MNESDPPLPANPPHAANLRIGRHSESLACYSITKCVYARRDVLASPGCASILLESIQYLRTADRFRLLAFCIMPDHYHLLVFLLPGHTLRQVMESLGKYTSRRINWLLGTSGKFWQDEYYDHRCRTEAEIEDALMYIEHNPVRSGLVPDAALWELSSAHPSAQQMLDRAWYAEVR